MCDPGKIVENQFESGLNIATLGAYGGAKAAEAQGNIAKAQLEQQQADRAQALSYAEATPQELAQLSRAIVTNENDINRKQKLLESADPAMIEAGRQALSLLKGEDAKILSPLRSQHQKQESELRNRLTAQLGPGYETSTAGVQALSQLRESQDAQLTNAQQGTLGQLLGVTQGVSAAGYGNAAATSANIGQAFGDIQKRKIAAVTGSPITGAGAQFVESLQQARASQQTLQNVIQVGSAIAGAGGFSGGGGGSVPGGGSKNGYTANDGSY